MSEIIEALSQSPSLVSLLTFLIGLLVGNWQAIGRDKRKEFNDISQPAFFALKKQIKNLEQGGFSNEDIDFAKIETHLNFFKRISFAGKVKEYIKAHEGISTYCPETQIAEFNIVKLQHLKLCASRILPFLKRR